MQFTPLGPWGVGASAGPATEGLKASLKGLSGHALQILLVFNGGRVGKGLTLGLTLLFLTYRTYNHET